MAVLYGEMVDAAKLSISRAAMAAADRRCPDSGSDELIGDDDISSRYVVGNEDRVEGTAVPAIEDVTNEWAHFIRLLVLAVEL